jgi:hypothetical protein
VAKISESNVGDAEAPYVILRQQQVGNKQVFSNNYMILGNELTPMCDF